LFSLLSVVVIVTFCSSCKKSDYLSAKPDEALIIPAKLKDFEALLDNVIYMNGYGGGLIPGLAEIGSDNYYEITDEFTSTLSHPFFRSVYTWQDDNLYTDKAVRPNDWGFAYRCIFYANTVLEGLNKLKPSPDDKAKYDRLKASALFYRAHMYYWLVQIFSPHYQTSTANSDLGIPLKSSADINEPLTRASLQQTYEKIILDLDEAKSGLPDLPTHITRPSKLALYGLLARVYLTIQDFDKALSNANAYLALKDNLLDYNSIEPSPTFPMPDPSSNIEIAFYAIIARPNMELITPYSCRIDSNLYNTFNDDDLRKDLYFGDAASYYGIPGDNGNFFRGSYDATDKLFAGISTDEIFLIRAECYARKGNKDPALVDLNKLTQTRWKSSVPFPTITAIDAADALNKILAERRKELVFRGLRWTDLRRLNKEGANIILTRSVDGQTYTLQPNSLKYTYLIPTEVISFNPGMQQNPR
jgi:starch-binding outer membrane protein, SusD/RagB family